MKLKYYLRTLGIGIIVTALLMGVATKKQRDISDDEIRERAKKLGMVDAGSYVLSDLIEDKDEGIEEESISEVSSVPESKLSQDTVTESSVEDSVEETPEEHLEESSARESTEDSLLENSEEESLEESLVEENSAEESSVEESSIEESSAEENSVEESSIEESSVEESSAEEDESSQESTPNVENSETVTFTVNSGDSSDRVSKRLADLGLIENAVEFDAYLCRNGYDKKISVGTYEIPVGSSFEAIAKIITRS